MIGRNNLPRTREELERALVVVLELVTDCLSWLRYCGYQVAPNLN